MNINLLSSFHRCTFETSGRPRVHRCRSFCNPNREEQNKSHQCKYPKQGLKRPSTTTHLFSLPSIFFIEARQHKLIIVVLCMGLQEDIQEKRDKTGDKREEMVS
ncbi:unnamed protein product [Ilex paraguariensis]|uniref:Uncharacterized protein n=1 Tax=Ilex paraguariensis TaxID=185542 RepID=A0ABC8R8A1_9AQUA